MPLSVSAGMAEKKASNAASPPADAPMPTTGNPEPGFAAVNPSAADGVSSPGSRIFHGASSPESRRRVVRCALARGLP